MTEHYSKAPWVFVTLAGLIDAAIIICLPIFFLSITESLLGLVLYRFITIFVFDATLGMQVFSLRFLNGEQESLSEKEKILAALFVLFEGVDYYRVARSFS